MTFASSKINGRNGKRPINYPSTTLFPTNPPAHFGIFLRADPSFRKTVVLELLSSSRNPHISYLSFD